MTTTQDIGKAVHLLAAINRLNLKSFSSGSRQGLIFLILNDTIQIIKYDRAILWEFDESGSPSLLGVSGQAKISKKSAFADHWLSIIKNIPDVKVPQILSAKPPEIKEGILPAVSAALNMTSILWLPIFSQDKLALGLMLERWNTSWQYDEIEILNYLMKGYGAAWGKYIPRFSLTKLLKRRTILFGLLLTVIILSIRVPLRISAPCEIVAKDPVMITAPVEGTIEKVVATPGEFVKKGDILVQYDKRIPLEELKVAEKQVQISKSELERANNLSAKDPHALTDLAVLALKLKKEAIQLDLAKYRASLLTIKAPENGVIMIDNPDEWRGHPVKIGEKIMMIADPQQTKIQIWVPENDNITLDLKKPIKIYLNVSPEKSHYATLSYISSYSSLSDKSIQSFTAEAEWQEPPKDIKMGLKGTAILYGDNVSIFYLGMRRPFSYLRNLFGF